MTARFATNPHYVEGEERLKQLSRLMAEGRGDTDEADALRDALDLLTHRLTLEEIERLNGLSADLYMLTDEEIYEPLEPGEDPADRAPDRLRQRLQEADDRNDASAVLSLLRRGTAGFEHHERAYLRASAYETLGHLDTALVFMTHAAERNPSDSDYRAAVLDLRDRLDRREERGAARHG